MDGIFRRAPSCAFLLMTLPAIVATATAQNDDANERRDDDIETIVVHAPRPSSDRMESEEAARHRLERTPGGVDLVDEANGRFFEPGDGRAFYGGLEWRWN